MTYKLFIDDERFPPEEDDDPNWITARSVEDAKRIIGAFGWPQFISFDHDLGDNVPSGKDFANWIVDCDIKSGVLPKNFSFYVHSQNPVGVANIKGLLTPYLRFKDST